MMEKIFYGLLALMLAAGCTKPYQGFVLHGKFNGNSTGKIYLNYVDSLGNRVCDSTALSGGMFTFKGGINCPTNVYLVTSLGPMAMDDPGFVDFWIEPAEMQLELAGNNFKNFTLKGSATNEEEQELNGLKAPIRKEMEPLEAAYRAEKDPDKAAELHDRFDPFYERMKKIDLDFVKTHPDSYISANIIRYMVSSMPVGEAQRYYDVLSDRMKQTDLGKEAAEEIQNLKNGSPGSPAALFAKEDINGEMFDMASLKGQKYVILDFWASWCRPCRQSNPHLKELYRKYKDKGLEVVCVSDDDMTPDKWREAVEKDGIQAFRHVLRGLKQTENGLDRSGDISDRYGIHSLPTKILIDKEGMIIGRYGGGGGTEEDMDRKLKEIFDN